MKSIKYVAIAYLFAGAMNMQAMDNNNQIIGYKRAHEGDTNNNNNQMVAITQSTDNNANTNVKKVKYSINPAYANSDTIFKAMEQNWPVKDVINLVNSGSYNYSKDITDRAVARIKRHIDFTLIKEFDNVMKAEYYSARLIDKYLANLFDTSDDKHREAKNNTYAFQEQVKEFKKTISIEQVIPKNIAEAILNNKQGLLSQEKNDKLFAAAVKKESNYFYDKESIEKGLHPISNNESYLNNEESIKKTIQALITASIGAGTRNFPSGIKVGTTQYPIDIEKIKKGAEEIDVHEYALSMAYTWYIKTYSAAL